MSDVNPDSKDESKAGKTEGVNFSERYSDVMGKVNESLSKIDWTQRRLGPNRNSSCANMDEKVQEAQEGRLDLRKYNTTLYS
jgi:hypothetical protein